ncbi:MAG: radical SAM protein, partial [Bacteroidota bacterium]
MNKFYQELQKYDWDNILNQIYSRTENDVKQALAKERLTIHDFQALISPAAEPYLELMAQKSMQITQKRFGKTIQMYIPLYISNACTNSCVYCGFNRNNKFDRTILALNEIMEEAAIIKNMGFKHILLVTGEDEKHCGASYIKEIIEELNQDFSHISIEVQPLASSEYKKMKEYGLNTVYIYQET